MRTLICACCRYNLFTVTVKSTSIIMRCPVCGKVYGIHSERIGEMYLREEEIHEKVRLH